VEDACGVSWPGCARADPRKEPNGIRSLCLTLIVAAFLASATPAGAHAPGCRTIRCDRHAYRLWLKHHPYTGYVVEGKTSTFGWPLEDGVSGGRTADGGSTRRPCIAILEHFSIDHWFLVEVDGRKARLLHCDYGPEAAGRMIDITGIGDEALGISPSTYPTEAWGRARELR
jgi:hypothetical protein